MPQGDEDVTSSLDSSTSETQDSQQVQTDAIGFAEVVDANPQEASEQPPAPSAGSDAKSAAPDPVAEAIAKLSRPEGGIAPPKVKEPPKQATAQEDVSKEVPPPKPKAGPTLEDPFAGWLETDQQRNMLKPQTRERINELHKKWKEAETHPIRQLGSEFDSMLTEHGLQEDLGYVPPGDLAGLIKAQAAISRSALAIQQGRRPAQADLQVYQELIGNLDKIGKSIGAPVASAPPSLTPVEGSLPPEYQDLIDLYGLPESRVRLLAAVEKSSKPQAPAPQQSAPAPQPTPDRNALPEGVDTAQIYVQRINGVLARDGIPAERMKAYREALEPTMSNIVLREFPGIQPQQVARVFNAMSPKERADIILQAHTEFRKASSPPSKPPLAPPTKATAPRSPMRQSAPDSNLDPVQSAIARLMRPVEAE